MMNHSSKLSLGLMVVLSLALAGCNKSDTTPKSATDNKPINQVFGKNYVREIPPSEVKKKEKEMTSSQSEQKQKK